jgi:AAA domain
LPTVSKVKSNETQRPVIRTDLGPSAWDLVNWLRVLVYGESGSGKTTFAATFPAPILWLVCSGGNKPGELRSLDTPEHRKRITAVVVQDSGHYAELMEKTAGFQTVVLDHASGYADLVLKEILGLSTMPAQKGWGLASQSQYGQQSLQLKESFRTLLNVPANVVIIAQQRTFGSKDGPGGDDMMCPVVGAALTPSVVGWLNPACDFVVNCFKKARMKKVVSTVAGAEQVDMVRGRGVEYCLRTGPHDVFQTKFRIPKGRELPEYLVDASYDSMMKLIRG